MAGLHLLMLSLGFCRVRSPFESPERASASFPVIRSTPLQILSFNLCVFA
jgi:hypothetical protein